MLHMVQKHGGQQLTQESVAQLRQLDRAACVFCDTIRSRRCHRCSHCRRDTPTRDIVLGDTFQDHRQPGPVGSPAVHHLALSSQPVPQGDPFDDSTPPNCTVWDIANTERDKQLLVDLCSASAMATPRCRVCRYATAWAESLEGAIRGHQSWAMLCRYRCRLLLAEVPKGSDRNAELKLRLQLWEVGEISKLIGRILEQQHPGPLLRRKRKMLPQRDEQRG